MADCNAWDMSRAVAWLLALAVLCWTLVRLLGLDRGWPLVPLVAFTPYVALAGVLATVLIAALRRWAAAGVAGVCVVVLVALVAPRGLADGAPSGADSVALRVLTANLQAGDGAIPELIEIVRRERVDVLSVQELTLVGARALEAVAPKLPERALQVREGSRGTGLYARVPLRPLPPARGTFFAMAAAEARPPGTPPVQLVAVHARAPVRGPDIVVWRRDLRALPRARPRGALRVLAGDFNATLDHRELRRLIGSGYRDAAAAAGQGLRTTWPAGRRLPPGLAIDHVLADRRAAVRSARVVSLPGTDHRAVLTELRLPG